MPGGLEALLSKAGCKGGPATYYTVDSLITLKASWHRMTDKQWILRTSYRISLRPSTAKTCQGRKVKKRSMTSPHPMICI